MKAKKFFYDGETYYKVSQAGHRFTVLQDTPIRFFTILADGYPVSLPAAGTLDDAVNLALIHCL